MTAHASDVPVDLTADLLARLTLEQKVRLLTGQDFWTLPAEPAIGLRPVVFSDGPAGVRGPQWDERYRSANIPSPTALGASWDTALVAEVGGLLAAECRRQGVDVLLAPTVNLQRSPYAGRHFEYLGEDPLLTGRIGAALVDGLQDAGVGACVKHFVANDSETDRFTLDAHVDPDVLDELYLAPFRHVIAASRPWTVMAAYNAVNGYLMTESPLLRELLRDAWGFDGVVVSDWGAARRTVPTACADLDLVMPGPGGPWGEHLVAAVREGRVAESDVDRKVLGVLRLAARVGALDGVPPARPIGPAAEPDEVSRLLRRTAAAGTVLLRNAAVGGPPAEGAPLLPLDPGALRRVAVLGPNAARARTLGGGSAQVFPPHVVSPLDGIRAALPDATVDHAPGVRASSRVPTAELDLLADADGRPGVDVAFLDAADAVLAREQRPAASFRWFGGLDPAAATIEVRTRLTPDATGAWTVAVGGAGRLTLAVDAVRVLDTVLQPEDGVDPVELLSSPPQGAGTVDLVAGREVEIVLRHAVGSSATWTSFVEDLTTFSLGLERPHGTDDEEIARAVEIARAADVAVVVVGTTDEVESEGYDRTDLVLPGRQDDLVRAVAAVAPRTVVVVNAGAPVLLPWSADVPAVLVVWFPGQEAGDALADVLLGAIEPGGRLPVTWPADETALPSTTPVEGVLRYDEGLRVGYRDPARRTAFPFGHGLGYTDWDYGAPTAERDAAGRTTVSVPLRNVGPRAGREVVQVYVAGEGTPVLAGFTSVDVAAGESTVVQVLLDQAVLRGSRGCVWVGRSIADRRVTVSLPP